MADFAIWAAACEGALWEDGAFQAAYSRNLDGAVESVIDADTVACAVRAFMADRSEWEGTATLLLAELSGAVPDRISRSKTWPENARSMSGRLRRAAPMLRKVGMEITFPAGHNSARILTITNRPETARDFASLASFASYEARKCNNINGNRQDANIGGQDAKPNDRTQNSGQDARDSATPPLRPVLNQLKNKEKPQDRTQADGRDAKIPIVSGWEESI
jgi:hypothetical protein